MNPIIKNKGTNELWQWTAVELAQAIKTKKISSHEAVTSCLNRIKDVNPRVNAIVEVSEEEALAAADEADRAVSKGEPLGALHGVPVSIKVNTDQAGHATTNGVTAFRDNIAAADSPQVANLRKDGAIFVGRSNTPTFSLRWSTTNDLHGKTLNPWVASRTPGGSSGGAAAAVATGMVPIAQANDIGGSIRYPAYACGVTGIRPTVGRVPGWTGALEQDQAFCSQMMSVEGPIARTVGDLRLSLASMSKFDPRGVLYAPAPFMGDPLQRPIRVGLLRDVGVAEPDSTVNKALDEAADRLKDAGYIVEEIDLPLFAEAYRLWYLLCMEEIKQIKPLIDQFGDDGIKKSLNHDLALKEEWWGADPGLAGYLKGHMRRGTLIAQLEQFLQDYPLLLLPVSAEQAFEEDADIMHVERVRQIKAAQWSMMAISLLGFPAITVSTSVVNGLPVGVQILGRKFREDTIFDAAEVLETHASITTPIDPR